VPTGSKPVTVAECKKRPNCHNKNP